MAQAYAYCNGDTARPPDCMRLAQDIERYGVKAVTGYDIMPSGLIRNIRLAEYTVNTFNARARSQDYAGWNNANPDEAKFLDNVFGYAVELGMI